MGWSALIANCAVGGQKSTLPRTIHLGSMPSALRPLLAEDCSKTEELHYTGKMAAPFDDQVQINCSNLDVFGARRDVEFMFNDGPLGHVWILIRAEESSDLRRSLEEAFGPVVYETQSYAVFASGNVALRRDPPEVLVATPNLITEITGFTGVSP
jgi:hypothetical protein